MSKITVTTIAGATSGSDANKVKIESGDELNVVNGDLTVDTDTLFVDASNNRVGIGTASPTQDLTIVNSGSARMELVSGTSGTSIIDMGDSADKDIGGIRYVQSSDRLQFRAGNDVRVSIDSNGLKFGSDTAAANALDDYEEGTWTPSFASTGTQPTISYSVQSGNYTKIGRLVTVNFNINTSSVSGGSGELRISGLPFSLASGHAAGSRAGNMQHWNSSVDASIGGFVSNTQLILAKNNNVRITVSDLRTSNDSNQLWWTLSYPTDA